MLVTLGIIGVVSAMTVPTLMQNYQRKSYVTQLHKVYNELSQAIIQYQTDRNAVNLKEAGLTSIESVENFIRQYFKVVKECETLDGCFADEYKRIDGQSAFFDDAKSFVLASGASIRTSYTPGGNNGNLNVYFAIDVNGMRGPNILGRDCFFVFIYNNGVIDDNTEDVNISAPLSKEERETRFEEECFVNGTAGCFGKILNDNWEMTY